MNKIKRLWFLPLCLTLSCATLSTWWQNFEKDPVAQIQLFLQDAGTVLSDAEAAWSLIQPFLTPAQQQAVAPTYTKAVADTTHAMAALSDALKAAAAAQTSPAPDLTTLKSAVTDALGQLLDILSAQQGTTTVSLRPAAPLPQPVALANPALDEAKARLAALKASNGVKSP